MDYAPGTETVLLVDDEELLRSLVAEMLGSLGYRVLTAADGKEALALAENQTADIDLLITDLLIPGMDGIHLAKALRAKRPKLSVLFVTGDTAEASTPGTCRLDKPFTLRMLAAKVRELLDS